MATLSEKTDDSVVARLYRHLQRTLFLVLVCAALVTTVAATVGTGVAPIDRTVAEAAAEIDDAIEERTMDDTDGDGLYDSREANARTEGGYPLPGADPSRKDLYVRVYVSAGVDPLSERELSNLRTIWAEMPVSNPNASDGITLHVTQVQLDRPVRSNLSEESVREIERRIYQERLPAAARCSVHAVVLADVPGQRDRFGLGSTPGYLSVIDGTETGRYGTAYTVRTSAITHELLHNVVGTFDDGSAHTDDGWLSHGRVAHGAEFHMSDQAASELSADGFAESQYFEEKVC